MREKIQVLISTYGRGSVNLKRFGRTSLDRTEEFNIPLEEVEEVISRLQGSAHKIAQMKRVEAQRLLTEAEQLDPSV